MKMTNCDVCKCDCENKQLELTGLDWGQECFVFCSYRCLFLFAERKAKKEKQQDSWSSTLLLSGTCQVMSTVRKLLKKRDRRIL